MAKTEHYYRQLDQAFERTEAQRDRAPYYWPLYGADQRKMCSYCGGPVEEFHPAQAQDVCPTYERYLADVPQ